MELKGRLKLIAHKVPACDTLFDIGTDHGYIPISLMEKGICKKAVGADVKKGPLMAAAENIKLNGMEGKISVKLGDGLAPVEPGSEDVVVIAGMGGILIKDILKNELDKAKKAKALILQPMNAIEITREWLFKNGFDIFDEELVSEGEKIYVVLSARWTGFEFKGQMMDYYVGKRLIEKKDPLLKKYLTKKLRQSEGILKRLKKSKEDNSDVENRHKYLADGYSRILNMLDDNALKV